jgi:hypothetical protein
VLEKGALVGVIEKILDDEHDDMKLYDSLMAHNIYE